MNLRRCAAALLLLAGCDPFWTVKGTVSDGAVAGRALPGAHVQLQCSNEPGQPRTDRYDATANPDGSFDMGSIGYIERGCGVQITADGYQPQTFEIADTCKSWHSHDMCIRAEIDAALIPEAGPR